jgi:hypothetical protein
MIPRSLALGAAVAALALAIPSAPARAKSRETYVFLISRVELAKGVPKEVEAQVLARLGTAVAEHADLEASLPAAAPDPEAQPQKFKDYLKARRQRAFKVNVDVSEYSIEAATETRRDATGQVVIVRVALQLFGETMPDRVMAFSGEGSATVKLEVGKTVRPRDREEATSAAIDEAVASAITRSLEKLQEPPPSEKKTKKKKSGKK